MKILPDRDLEVLVHLARSPSGKDYIGSISRRCGHPYNSVKATISRLMDVGFVEEGEDDGAIYNYFQLTRTGSGIVKVIIDNTIEVPALRVS